MTTRTCTKCGETKDIEEFLWSIRGVKRHSRCRTCQNEERMERYKKNKESELEYKYDRQVRKREEARHYVFEYLSTHPCTDCGIADPYVLTFDHITGNKKMNISQMVNQGYSLEAIQTEISECVVRCANCHMRIEKQRRGTKYW
jgi:hypothetical protein